MTGVVEIKETVGILVKRVKKVLLETKVEEDTQDKQEIVGHLL